MKLIVEVLLIVALVTQIANSNVIGDKELETKIQAMWEKVNTQMNNFEAKLKKNVDSGEEDVFKSIKDVITKMRAKYNEHFTKMEEEARKNGTLEHVNIETPFFKIAKDILNELKNNIGENIMTFKDFDSSKKTQLVKAIDDFYMILINCMQTLVDESSNNPLDVFVNYEVKYLKDKLERLKGIRNKCKENIRTEETKLDAKIDSLDVPENILNNISLVIF